MPDICWGQDGFFRVHSLTILLRYCAMKGTIFSGWFRKTSRLILRRISGKPDQQYLGLQKITRGASAMDDLVDDNNLQRSLDFSESTWFIFDHENRGLAWAQGAFRAVKLTFCKLCRSLFREFPITQRLTCTHGCGQCIQQKFWTGVTVKWSAGAVHKFRCRRAARGR